MPDRVHLVGSIGPDFQGARPDFSSVSDAARLISMMRGWAEGHDN